MSVSSKREKFNQYLAAGKVVETLERAMKSLQEQSPRPEDPLAFIREVIGAPPAQNVDALVRKNQQLRTRVIQLKNLLSLPSI
ncbi:hypothetical protein TVAG_296150 [Trichomonas vaginalis G3]|uniref:c-Myc-binding protein n=1 Tax=Trichomonas vaginalis (strain ATCC PRA-98 / G3) TaxID=412133 RepID=A2F764_TRIV3|nr:hypothetical protein TVAGG3_0162290 [Trichomonas vaginalis G3]EAX99231.1 hypothetical protein TVAG_296150 [Trichomonas vaginalis G3]KAI5547950.1 hypothetical protein TVAGG3_0162290 [Trichomonas vaginalis G3]|eukprot:XP_001312161.1 hypothetical protein [Trichomonas vaginalis G3]